MSSLLDKSTTDKLAKQTASAIQDAMASVVNEIAMQVTTRFLNKIATGLGDCKLSGVDKNIIKNELGEIYEELCPHIKAATANAIATLATSRATKVVVDYLDTEDKVQASIDKIVDNVKNTREQIQEATQAMETSADEMSQNALDSSLLKKVARDDLKKYCEENEYPQYFYSHAELESDDEAEESAGLPDNDGAFWKKQMHFELNIFDPNFYESCGEDYAEHLKILIAKLKSHDFSCKYSCEYLQQRIRMTNYAFKSFQKSWSRLMEFESFCMSSHFSRVASIISMYQEIMCSSTKRMYCLLTNANKRYEEETKYGLQPIFVFE